MGEYSSFGHSYDYGSSSSDYGNYGGFSVDNSGRAVVMTDHNNLNKYWANMHRQWGHQRETRLNGYGEPNNNLVDYTKNGVTYVSGKNPDPSNEGKHGKNWGDSWDVAWKDQPWLEDDDLDVTDSAGGQTHD